MNYEIDKNIAEFMALYDSNTNNSEKYRELFKFLAANLSVIANLDTKTEFYRYMDVLLGAIINTNLEREDKFNAVCESVLEQGEREGLQAESVKIKAAIENVWNLLNKTEKYYPQFIELLDENLRTQIKAHISKLAKIFHEERLNYQTELLHEASDRDIKAQMSGERLNLEEQESYQIAQKISRREI